ncbi:MAG: hypothetical protein ACRDTG_25130 [Pseudonocardiaceae bacterium]
MTTTQVPRKRTATVNLPFVTAEFRAPEIHLPSIPDRSDLTGAVSAIRERLPSPAQVAYYAGLGVLGVLELVEWPVVLAIGVGTAIAQRSSRLPEPPAPDVPELLVPDHVELPQPARVPTPRRGKA